MENREPREYGSRPRAAVQEPTRQSDAPRRATFGLGLCYKYCRSVDDDTIWLEVLGSRIGRRGRPAYAGGRAGARAELRRAARSLSAGSELGGNCTREWADGKPGRVVPRRSQSATRCGTARTATARGSGTGPLRCGRTTSCGCSWATPSGRSWARTRRRRRPTASWRCRQTTGRPLRRSPSGRKVASVASPRLREAQNPYLLLAALWRPQQVHTTGEKDQGFEGSSDREFKGVASGGAAGSCPSRSSRGLAETFLTRRSNTCARRSYRAVPPWRHPERSLL